MSYVGYGQSPYVPEPKVRFDAIGEAWNLVREKMGVWIPITLILGGAGALVYFGVNMLVSLVLGTGNPTPNPNNPFSVFSPVMIFAIIITGLINMVIGAFISSSFYRVAIKQVRGEDITLSDAFKFGDNIGNVILTNFLMGIITTIGCLLCYIPGIIASIGMMMAVPLAVDRGLPGTEPIAKSWEKMKGQLGNGFVLVLVLGLIMMLSALLLGLGLLVTLPLTVVTMAIVYRDLFETEGGLRAPQLDIPLPPPSAFGVNSGLPGQPPPYGQNPGATPGTPPPPGQNPPPSSPGQMGQIQM